MNQGGNAVAIGRQAGSNTQGSNSIAIGYLAGNSLQANNSIVLNASGADQPAPLSGFYVDPVRNDTGNITNTVYYNTSTNEITYSPNIVTVTTPVPYANLTAVAGGRAFVNNSNLAAVGNFGAQISGGGSNIVPVWSNGTNWFIG